VRSVENTLFSRVTFVCGFRYQNHSDIRMALMYLRFISERSPRSRVDESVNI